MSGSTEKSRLSGHMTELEQQEEALFNAAQELADVQQRAAFLDAACAGNTELRRRLEELFAVEPEADAFFEKPRSVTEGLGVRPDDGPAAELAENKPKTSAPSGPATDVAGDQIGRYKLLQKLGEGGFGEVWMAEQREPVRRRVALKIIKLGMNSKQVVARFEAERQALALMDHPNIAKVLDGGVTGSEVQIPELIVQGPQSEAADPKSKIQNQKSQIQPGRPYFVMELVRGVRITEYCEQEQLSVTDRLGLFIKVCQAIQHAHQKGVIHRDIKPANILVTVHDGGPVPKVIDFGIAKATQLELTDKTVFTQFHQFIGTPVYMSPEQAEMSGLDIDTRSDIYSLGVLLYELLIGQTPFDAQELMALGLDGMRKVIREKEPVRPSTRLSQTLEGADVGRLSQNSELDGACSSASTKAAVDGRRLLQAKETIALLRGDLDWIVMKCLEKDRSRRYETANGLVMDIERYLKNEPVLARPPSATYRLGKTIRRHRAAFAAAAMVAATLVLGAVVSTWQAVRATRAQASEKEQRVLAQQKQAEAEASDRKSQNLLYAASINLALQAWERNNAARTRRTLEETVSHSDRGFEWYYLQRLLHLEQRTLRGHRAPVVAIFSPDDQKIFTLGEDSMIKVWDTASGQERMTFRGAADHSIHALAISPDGRRLATANSERLYLWDSANGQHLWTFKVHEGRVSSSAFSPDGQRIVTGGSDRLVKFWRTMDGQELLVLKGHAAPVRCVAISRDGQRIASGSADRTAKVWDANSGQTLLTLTGHALGIDAVAFTPDGRGIVTGSEDQTAALWDSATGQRLVTFKGHTSGVASVAISPDGKQILTGSGDQTARVWEIATGQEVCILKGHEAGLKSAVFSSDGKRILTGSMDHTTKLWDANPPRESLVLTGHNLPMIWTAHFSPDGDKIVTAGGDQTARVWRSTDGKELLTLRGHGSGVRSAAFSPNGQRILTGGDDRTAKIWDVMDGRELMTLAGHSNLILSVSFSPDGERAITGSTDRTIKVWHLFDGRELFTLKGHNDNVVSVAFSPDGTLIASGSFDRTIKLWDAATGQERRTLKNPSGAIFAVAFSKDGHRLLSGSQDRTAKLWAIDTGEELLTLHGHGSTVTSVAFSPDGSRIVTAGSDQTVKLWAGASGLELLTLRGHQRGINYVNFSPDGRRIATAGADQTVRVWETASEQQVARWREEKPAAADTPASQR
jgi:WD40 repeat protein/serine/threonine protein kinase